jgi:hypothetical protein
MLASLFASIPKALTLARDKRYKRRGWSFRGASGQQL